MVDISGLYQVVVPDNVGQLNLSITHCRSTEVPVPLQVRRIVPGDPSALTPALLLIREEHEIGQGGRAYDGVIQDVDSSSNEVTVAGAQLIVWGDQTLPPILHLSEAAANRR